MAWQKGIQSKKGEKKDLKMYKTQVASFIFWNYQIRKWKSIDILAISGKSIAIGVFSPASCIERRLRSVFLSILRWGCREGLSRANPLYLITEQ